MPAYYISGERIKTPEKIEVAAYVKSIFGSVPLYKITKEVRERAYYNPSKWEPEWREV